MCKSESDFLKRACIIILVSMGVVGLSVANDVLLKDPTAPQEAQDLNKNQDQIKDLHLFAIFISGDERHAVINNAVVKKGDKIGNKVVQEIDPYTVTLLDEGKEKKLYLLGSETSVKGQLK